jgi:DNA-binding XRE family transcriptional regulator
MPVSKTKTNPTEGIRLKRPARSPRPDAAPTRVSFVMEGDKPTHVMIPVRDYDRMISALEERDRKRTSRSGEWIPAEKAALQTAADWLRDAREEAGLTQQQLADQIGVPQSQISRIEKNPDRTTIRTIKRIAAALRVDVGALVSFAAKA